MVVLGLVGLFAARGIASAHCDTLDGPVVADARLALSKGDVAPVLKWIKAGDEATIKDAFSKTLAVRGKGPEARDLADMYFFETLVRIHRAGEGAPYTGLKPAGTDPGTAVAAADRALATGSADALIKLITDKVADGIQDRFAEAYQARKHADESTLEGRQSVQSYVEFVHHAERLYDSAGAPAGHAADTSATPAHEEH